MAEKDFDLGNFEKAVELYARGYQFNPIRNKEEFLRSLQAYGKDLVNQQEFTKAKEQFQRILKIESNIAFTSLVRYDLKSVCAFNNGSKNLGVPQLLGKGYNLLAEEKIQEINEITKHEILNKEVNIDSESSLQFTAKRLTVFPSVLLAIGVILIIITVIGVLIYQSSTACPKGEQKLLRIICVKDLRD